MMNDIKLKGYIVKRAEGEPSILNGGFLKIDPASQDYAQDALNKLKGYDGRKLDILITDEQSWSSRMNRLFHALIHKIHKEGAVQYWSKIGRAPETFEEVKTWVKVTLCGAKVEQVGEMVWVESWKNFSKKRALQSIDNVLQYCMDVGVDIDSDRIEYEYLKGGNNA